MEEVQQLMRLSPAIRSQKLPALFSKLPSQRKRLRRSIRKVVRRRRARTKKLKRRTLKLRPSLQWQFKKKRSLRVMMRLLLRVLVSKSFIAKVRVICNDDGIVCSLPPEYCMIDKKDFTECKNWVRDNHPDLYN